MMKIFLTLFLSFSVLSIASAQSIMDVPANDNEGNPITNALIQYVVADTNENGKQLHDIYRLERGKTYFYNQSPVFKNPITLVADEPGDTDETKPPKIIITTNDEGEVPYEHCITTFANLTIKNIAFTTTSIEEGYSWANAILLQADDLKIVLENCYFELIGWGMIEAVVNNTVFILDRCHVRNGTVIPDGDEWVPFFFEIDTGTVDSLIVRNSTFFNLQGSIINIEQQSPVNNFIFDHNTCVNVVKGFSTAIHAHLNSTITNNIFYNVSTHGALLTDISTGEDQIQNGIINVDTLISNEPNAPDSLAHIMDEANREIVVSNNAYFYTPGVKDYWTSHSDSVEAPMWINSRSQAMFDDDATWPNFVAENNVEIDPGFTNFGGTDQMVAQLNNHRDNSAFGFWGWDPDSADYPEVHWAFLQWPLPEDFSYSANITSTDGYHVGSLVYYPSELEDYILTDINENTNVPTEFSLEQNYPNPFNPTTNIKFSLVKAGEVSLVIYNAIGQEIKSVLKNQHLNAGAYQNAVDMSGFSSGVYFYTLKQKNNVHVQKMILMK